MALVSHTYAIYIDPVRQNMYFVLMIVQYVSFQSGVFSGTAVWKLNTRPVEPCVQLIVAVWPTL